MTPEEQYIEQQQKELDMVRMQASNTGIQQDLAASQLREETIGLVREQLSLDNELETIRYLLKGYDLKINDEGVQAWAKPESQEMEVLTDYGVQLVMNTIMFYLNKNTLLSNYEETLILQKMEDFSTSLADTIFMEYEKVFRYPTLKECKTVLEDRINKRVDERVFAYDLRSIKYDKEKIRKKIIADIIDYNKEITKIREQIMKNKLKRFDIIMREIQDAVHSTFLRAWNGQERRTLRQHIHISETASTGNSNVPMNVKPKKRWFK